MTEHNNLGDMGWTQKQLIALSKDNEVINWTDPTIDYFIRIRYIGEYIREMGGVVLDFSYAYAYTKDGKLHSVRGEGLPYQILCKGNPPLTAVRAAIINAAKRDKVFAKGLKALDNDVLSVLH